MPSSGGQYPSAPPAALWVVALAAAWILPGLVGHDPWKPDEAHTFGIAYSLLNGGDWLVPMLAGEPFMEKPPLYYWTAALFARVLSPPLALHDAARLASGFYLALTFVFVAAAARELYGRDRGGVAVLVLLGCLGLAIPAHQIITDTAQLAGFAAGFYGLALAPRRALAGGAWLGTGAGIGFLAKGLLAPGVLGLLALLLPLAPAWRTRAYAKTLAIAFVALLPWLVPWPWALYARSPALFNEWLFVNNFGRFTGSNDLGPHAQPLQYLRLLPWFALPALPLAGWALWRARRNLAAPPTALPLAGFVVLLLVLSAAAQARELYALPLLLPLALLATPGIDTLRRGAANLTYWFSIMGGAFFMAVAWFYWCALELGAPAKLHAHLHNLQPGYTPGFRWLPFAAGALYTVGWIVVLLRLRRGRERPAVAWAASMTMVWGVVATLFVGVLDAGKSYRSMIEELVRALPAQHGCVASEGVGEPQRALLHYFAGIATYQMETARRGADCEYVLVQWRTGENERTPMMRAHWETLWEGARPGDRTERFRLYRRVAAPAHRH